MSTLVSSSASGFILSLSFLLGDRHVNLIFYKETHLGVIMQDIFGCKETEMYIQGYHTR